MNLNIAVLPGDGIGPEVMEQAVGALRAVCGKFGHTLTLDYAAVGAHAIREVGNPFPEGTYRTCAQADAVLFAAMGDPKYDNDPQAAVRPEQGLMAMRQRLGLYANLRPISAWDELLELSPLKPELVRGADFVCVRELTGGMYFGQRYRDNDMAYDTDIYTRPEIERILRVGYEMAMRRRHHLTVVDKANILASSRLWRQIAQEMEPQHPDVAVEYLFVDNASMRLIASPRSFDVIVTENTFGDILTDEAACISGSMGLLPSASLGTGTPLFEPVHGSWPQAAGKDIANPLAMILCVAMMLEHFGLDDEGACVRQAVSHSISQHVRTPDLQVHGGPPCGTRAVGHWIAAHITAAR